MSALGTGDYLLPLCPLTRLANNWLKIFRPKYLHSKWARITIVSNTQLESKQMQRDWCKVCTSPAGYLMEWRPLVCQKAAIITEVACTNTISAFHAHGLAAHGAL